MGPLWAFQLETVGARTPPELHGTKTLDALTVSANVPLPPSASLA
jgi:hypothetical protein